MQRISQRLDSRLAQIHAEFRRYGIHPIRPVAPIPITAPAEPRRDTIQAAVQRQIIRDCARFNRYA